jgi:hypothetical protein
MDSSMPPVPIRNQNALDREFCTLKNRGNASAISNKADAAYATPQQKAVELMSYGQSNALIIDRVSFFELFLPL